MAIVLALLAQALVFQNGKVWTGESEVPTLACDAGRVVATPRSPAQVIDLRGRRALPGFHDSHAHVLSAGLLLSRVSLKDAPDLAELGRRLTSFDQKLPPGAWMVGGRWDHERALGGKLPDAALIDRYVKDRPVFLVRYDGHMAVANSKALRLAGIDAATKDPSGGSVDRVSGSREPTGILRDTATELVAVKIPPPGEREIGDALAAALAQAAREGVTALEDLEDDNQPATWARVVRRYHQLEREGKLTARVDVWRPIQKRASLAELGIAAGFGSALLRLGTVKGYLDGSLGSSTAKMFSAYLNDPTTGLFVTEPAEMRKNVIEADAAGLQIGVHAIGDRANAELLDVFEAATRSNGPRDRRFRVEHAQHLRAEDIPRFRQLGVVASMQPYHIVDDGRWAEKRVRAGVLEHSYALRELLDAGAVLAFGSDWPVAPLSPLLGIDAAVHRRTLDGKHPEGWFPRQRITPKEAVRGYTWGGAYASFRDADEGALTPGKLCDVVVLTRDVLAGEAEPAVAMTVLGGRVVFDSAEGANPGQR